MWDGTTLTSPNGGTIALNKKAKAALESLAGQGTAALETPQAGDRFPTPLDGGKDPAGSAQQMGVQLWYADPAEHPDAYLSITYETNGVVLVRDGNDPTGAALQFTVEQWSALVSDDEDAGLGEPEGDSDAPAAVKSPDELYKTPATGKNKPGK